MKNSGWFSNKRATQMTVYRPSSSTTLQRWKGPTERWINPTTCSSHCQQSLNDIQEALPTWNCGYQIINCQSLDVDLDQWYDPQVHFPHLSRVHDLFMEQFINQWRSQNDNSHIHIFMFCVIKFFSYPLFLWYVNTNIWIWAPPIIVLATPRL
jgi:hypothetical protein